MTKLCVYKKRSRRSEKGLQVNPPLSKHYYKRCTGVNGMKVRVHMLETLASNNHKFINDPSAGSPTETLLRLLLPLNDQV